METGKAKALIIYIGESDHWHGRPTYVAIVERARQEGLAGATVTKGIMSYGANSRIHRAQILALSEDLPITISIVDRPENIQKFLPILDEMVQEGLVMTVDVNVEFCRHKQ